MRLPWSTHSLILKVSVTQYTIKSHCSLSNLTEESAFAVRFPFILLFYIMTSQPVLTIFKMAQYIPKTLSQMLIFKAGIFAFMYCNLSFHIPLYMPKIPHKHSPNDSFVLNMRVIHKFNQWHLTADWVTSQKSLFMQ